MKATISHSLRSAGLLAGVVFGFVGLATANQAPSSFAKFDSYIQVTGYGADVQGNKSAFKRGQQNGENGGGIEALRYSITTEKDLNIEAEGRALLGAEDYLAKLAFSKDEFGSFEIGYKRYRTFYDGVGGFFPTSGRFLALTNRDIYVDRGRFWVNATLALPDKPIFSLRYSNELRNGRKDSTIWGSSSFTGLPYNVAPNPINPTRKFAPSYIDVDERNQELELSVKHTIKNTTLELIAIGSKVENFDVRWVSNSPGQKVPFPTPSGAVLATMDPVNWANETNYTQGDGVDSDNATVMLKAETVLNDQFTLRAQGRYQRVRADLTGYRYIDTWTPSASGGSFVLTSNYHDLVGIGESDLYTGIVALDYKPTKHLFLSAGVRAEDESYKANADFLVLAANGSSTPRKTWSSRDVESVTPIVEIRYTGIKNLSLYAKGSVRRLDGESRNTSAYNPLSATNGTLAINDNSENRDQFVVGGVWKPSSLLTVRTEAFTKSSSTEALGFESKLGDLYYFESDIRGLKLTSTVKPIETVAVTGRYVYQGGHVRTMGVQPTFPLYDSGDIDYHSVGGMIDWNPMPQFYVQLNGNVVSSVLRTVNGRAGNVAPSGSNAGYSADQILQNANNDYVTGSALVGMALTDNTDGQLQFTYYRSNNSDAQLATFTMPYGMTAREYVVTAGVQHKLTDKMVLNAKVGYVESRNETYGGYVNYRGPLAYVSVTHSL